MSSAGILLLINISIVFLMMLFQKISLRITRYDRLTIAIEYFPLRLLLYNFGKNKRRKKRLSKRLKRLAFFLVPTTKAILFLFKRSKIVLNELPSYEQRINEPHRFFIADTAEKLLKSYLFYALSYQFKETNVDTICILLAENSQSISTGIDMELSTRLYNLLLANFVFIFFSIKKKGRNKEIVGK